MTITYSEFDTTAGTLIADLKAAILTNAAWAAIAVTPVSTTSTGATTSAGNTVTLTSATGFTAGQWITVNPGATEVYKQVASVAGNVVTITTTWGAIFASGTTFRTRNNILKATTDRGADMIVDLEGADTNNGWLGLSLYRQWTGTAPGGQVDADQYSIYYRTSASTSAIPVHVTLSVSKNHLFIGLEGPRASELNPTSTIYGSVRNYFAVTDLVPYHLTDSVPAVIGLGTYSLGAPTVNNGGHRASISRDSINANSWQSGRLASLDWPTVQMTDVVTMNRSCTIDGKTYLLPYVLFSNTEGLRGRLKHFFYCGTTAPTPSTDLPEPVGSKVTYDGVTYKLLAVNKGDGAASAWGPFGSSNNTSGTTLLRSVVVAVPFADAA